MAIIRNPDKKIVEAIERQLAITGGQCPCAPEQQDNPDYKCPCKKFRSEKICCCQLYVDDAA